MKSEVIIKSFFQKKKKRMEKCGEHIDVHWLLCLGDIQKLCCQLLIFCFDCVSCWKMVSSNFTFSPSFFCGSNLFLKFSTRLQCPPTSIKVNQSNLSINFLFIIYSLTKKKINQKQGVLQKINNQKDLH